MVDSLGGNNSNVLATCALNIIDVKSHSCKNIKSTTALIEQKYTRSEVIVLLNMADTTI